MKSDKISKFDWGQCLRKLKCISAKIRLLLTFKIVSNDIKKYITDNDGHNILRTEKQQKQNI